MWGFDMQKESRAMQFDMYGTGNGKLSCKARACYVYDCQGCLTANNAAAASGRREPDGQERWSL